ncbi:SxtJ family membrane protein [Maridesulfovibrio sp.]|uniref:SxtJ family membrane protein n=1 Tax=Maridesulfovibrio sp. TaxID=2795000 RepID=UPI002A18E690|nr:SxtJ family membrane protein [Maridesulfovibrio sp.]
MSNNNQNTNGFFPAKISTKEASDTGMAMTLIALIAGLIISDRIYFQGAVVLLLITMTVPKIYKPIAFLWLGFSNLLGTVMSKIILTATFFLVVTPLALFRRLFRHDPMASRKWKKGSESVFVERNHKYSAAELEQPF